MVNATGFASDGSAANNSHFIPRGSLNESVASFASFEASAIFGVYFFSRLQNGRTA